MNHRKTRFPFVHDRRRLFAAIGFLSVAALVALAGRPLIAPGARVSRRRSETQCFTAVADAYVTNRQPTTNFGDDAELVVEQFEIDFSDVYVRFSLNEIPADATVTSASLELYLQSSDFDDVATNVRAAAGAWEEDVITWDNQPDASEQTYAEAVHGSAAGWKTWDVTGLVQSWFGGEFQNQGAIVRADAGLTRATFAAREAGTNRPRLCVEWTEPTETATPTDVPTETPTATTTSTPTTTPTPAPPMCETNGAAPREFLVQADASVREAQPTANFGSAGQLGVGWQTAMSERRYTYLRFDLSAIPTGATIRSAELRMRLDDIELPLAQNAHTRLFQIGDSWSESTITWNNRPIPLGNYGQYSHGRSPGWKTWSVEDFVKARLANRNLPDTEDTLAVHPAEVQPMLLTYAASEGGESVAPRLCIDWVRPTPTPTNTPTPTPTPTPTATPLADLSPDDMEITQGIQNLNNDVPLVERKETFVRVFPRAERGGARSSQSGVEAVLRAERGGSPLPNSPIKPVSGTVDIPVDWDRGDEEDAFLFRFPSSWDAEGTIDLEAEINSRGVIPEITLANNTINRTISFDREKEDICLVLVPVFTQKGTANPSSSLVDRMIRRAESMLPVPNIRYFNRLNAIPLQEQHAFGTSAFEANDENKIIWQLWQLGPGSSGSRPRECRQDGLRTHYAGVVPDGSMSFSGYAPGRGGGEGHTLWFEADSGSGSSIRGDQVNDPLGGMTLAHELGHNYGRAHVNCPRGSPNNPDQNYPYFRCNMGPTGERQYYGFDSVKRAAVPPGAVGDLMSYANRGRWPSDYTWKGILGHLHSASASAVPGSDQGVADLPRVQAAGDDLMVDALIESGVLSRVRWQRLPEGYLSADRAAELSASQAGEYEVRLLDGTGNVLASKSIAEQPISGAGTQGALLNTVMPFEDGTEDIQILREGSFVTGTVVSPHTPTVQVDTPNGGESVDSQLTVAWTADDADGDRLLHSVAYSPDRGETWLPLARRISSTTLTVGTGILPGSDGESLVRVLTSDGVNVAMDESDAPFSLPQKAPEAFIVGPEQTFFDADQPIYLDGVGTDLEDGFLQGEELRWSVEGLGQVGTGDEAYVADLGTGCHRVTLEAIDSDGQRDSDESFICVGVAPNQVYVPLILRDVMP